MSDLQNAVYGYLKQVKGHKTKPLYEQVLLAFARFVVDRNIAWENMFTLDTLREFQEHNPLTHITAALRGLSLYLFNRNKIPQPLLLANYQLELPPIYEDYLAYHKTSRQVSGTCIRDRRRVLYAFHLYLETYQVQLTSVTLAHLDAFLAEMTTRLSLQTCRAYLGYLRGLFRYLYQQRRMIKRNLAPLLVAPRCFAPSKPPMFYRPGQLEKLFASLPLSTARDLKTYAMVYLAYTLGLRPKEISLIRLDDLSFGKATLAVRERKNDQPVILPLPEHTLKAIAAYLVGGRSQSSSRILFLDSSMPPRPFSPGSVSKIIGKSIRAANLPGSAYWLRHSYAQNLLESGASLFEIKDMLGHGGLESTHRYLHVHIKLMRKVLFDETF